MSTVSEFLEHLIEESGGFGRFQIIQLATIIGSKISITWSLLMMSFAGATPNWWCEWSNSTGAGYGAGLVDNLTMSRSEKSCSLSVNGSSHTCPLRTYTTDMNTIVSEWDLVCDTKWIPATVSTIQMGGLLVSGFLTGQVADVMGRRPTYFGSIFLMAVSNIIAGFSSSWVMFAVMRFFIGFGTGMYLTVFYNYQIEFTPIRFRPIQIAIPDWSIWAAFLGLFAWLIHDWTYLHFLTGGVTGLFILSWWFIPESFRWLASTGRLDNASAVIEKIAKFNGKPVPNLDKLPEIVANDTSLVEGKKYTFLDLFKNREQLRRTFFVAVCWLSCGYGYYAISYSVDQLTGNLYLNMFLLSIIDIPALMATMFCNNHFGRRWTCFGFFVIGSIATVCVAICQVTEIEKSLKGRLINGFALAAKLGVSTAWGALMTFTTEIYPTVVRNLGYGIQNSVSRIGAMIAPQIILISQDVSGVMYFVCAAMMFLSAICCLCLPETKDRTIEDTLSSASKTSYDLDVQRGGQTEKSVYHELNRY